MSSTAALYLVLAAVGLYVVKQWLSPSKPYPPGPRPLPFIGNVLDIPQQYQWRKFCEWKGRYGDVISITVFGQRMVILNTVQASLDLLEKKGAQYSDRPVQHMAGTLMGWDQMLMMCPYDNRSRTMRRVLHRYLGGRGQLEKIQPFHHIIEAEVRRSLVWTLRSPKEFMDSARKATTGVSLRMGYGYQVKEGHDDVLELVERAVNAFIVAAIPGSFLVDTFPIMRYLPGWFPGQAWRGKAVQWRAITDEMVDVPYAIAKEKAIHEVGENNLVNEHVREDPNMAADKEYDIKKAVASMAGGTDTTVSALGTFYLAMTVYPEVQKRAQQEIDSVIGHDRLPTLEDRDRLPYLSALCTEVLRWMPAAPLGIPHLATADDVYQGYFIPKGSIIIPNLWQIMREPDTYSDPTDFKPERFLGENPELDPRDAGFGFGRRICPGLNLAQASLFAFCAMTLAVFNIEKVVENGEEVTPDVSDAVYHEDAVSHPPPFKCHIKPRSPSAEALILAED